MLNLWVRKIPLEKEMAPHSSILAWKILWAEEPGGLQSMGLQRAGHDGSDLAHIGKIREGEGDDGRSFSGEV